jgi:hypothetical protein
VKNGLTLWTGHWGSSPESSEAISTDDGDDASAPECAIRFAHLKPTDSHISDVSFERFFLIL